MVKTVGPAPVGNGAYPGSSATGASDGSTTVSDAKTAQVQTLLKQTTDSLDKSAGPQAANSASAQPSVDQLLGQIDHMLTVLKENPGEVLQLLGLAQGGLDDLASGGGFNSDIGRGLNAIEMPGVKGIVTAKVRAALSQTTLATKPDAAAIAARYGRTLTPEQTTKLQGALDGFVNKQATAAKNILLDFCDGKRPITNAVVALLAETGNFVKPGAMTVPAPPESKRSGFSRFFRAVGSAAGIGGASEGAQVSNALQELTKVLSDNPADTLKALQTLRAALDIPFGKGNVADHIVQVFDTLPSAVKSKVADGIEEGLDKSGQVSLVNVQRVAQEYGKTLTPTQNATLQKSADELQSKFVDVARGNLKGFKSGKLSFREVLGDLLSQGTLALDTKTQISSILNAPENVQGAS